MRLWHLFAISEPRHNVFGEDAHLAEQVVQVLRLERTERVLQARLPVLLQVLRNGVRAPREPLRASTGVVDCTTAGSSGCSMRR